MKWFQRWVALCAFTLSIFGQANQGSITGTVKDQTDAVVPNAPIEVRNTATGSVYTSGASATGNFLIPVPQGTYDMTVTVAGFKKFLQTGIIVVEGQASRRDVVLEVGQATDVITVTDTQPLLKTESGDITYRVTSQLANVLPVLQLNGTNGAMGNIRNPLSMATLLPGVSYNPTVFPVMVVNGLPANSQTWTIEGQDATPTLWRGVTADRGQGGVDAIEAMTVQTSNFAAEFGKAGGAAINYTMKSGTNQYHGSVYDYFVNEFMSAGTPFTDYAYSGPSLAYKSGQHVRNRNRRNDYGFTFGGPIDIPKVYDGHDKSFFFFNFEQFRQTNGTANGFATVPTAAYRSGDFNQAGCNDYDPVTQTCRNRAQITQNGQPAVDTAGNPILQNGLYDPNTYRVVNGIPVRDLLPGQKIPLSLMDRVTTNIQNQFPNPTNSNLTNNYNIPFYTTYRHTTIPSIKVDHNLSSTMRISGYWGQTITTSPNFNGFPSARFPWTSQQFNPYHNHTVRLNLDDTLSPTLILHIGIGYFHQREPNIANAYDQSKIGLPAAGSVNAYPFANAYPTIGGLNNFTSGGFSSGIGAGFDATAWEQKPTANLNLTWIKGNHNFKFGGDMTIQGYPTYNRWRANGNFTFSANQTGNPWEFGQTGLNIGSPTGFNYASFLLGQPDSLSLAQQTFTKLGGHAFAFFAQDNWKVTPKLTLEYGLRWDYQTYLGEQHGRHASASFSTFNPTVGLLGGLAYEGGGPCHCKLSSNYPLAFGPRLNAAYQITPKTVLRAGFGVNYNVVQTPAGNNFSVGDFYQINRLSYGVGPLSNGGFQNGNQFYAGNPFGNTEVVWPIFDPGRLPPRNGDLLPPTSPFSMYHPNSRPGRIQQWSIGIQHEVIRNLVIEASYVGNRGAWFYSPLLDVQAINGLAGGRLGLFGIDITKAADRTLLNSTITSPAAVARGLILPYAGYPGNNQVGDAIRPVPQWGTVNPYLGPYRGKTWYDSLQIQATKRYSHNLDLTANITWAKGMALGTSSDTDFFLTGRPTVTDPFNLGVNKQLNQLVPPLKTVISGTYITPGLPWKNGFAGKMTNLIVKDWQVGVVFQYQSGQFLATPTSNNGLSSQLRINAPANGAFGSGIANYNPWNLVPGASLFRAGFDPNGSWDPRALANPGTATDKNNGVLNGGSANGGACTTTTCAWSDPAAGQWGVTAPYLSNFRWRRRPSEAFNIGRNFRMGKDGKYVLNVRAEFQNIFNRTFYAAPSTSNPSAPVTTNSSQGTTVLTGGFGVINTFNGNGSSPRSGTFVARLTF